MAPAPTPDLWPAMTLTEAHARLTAPGAPFEVATADVRGIAMTVWRHVPATAAEAFAAARAFGPREFLVLGEERITYDGFARAVLKLSALLRERGLEKGDRVALAMRNLPEWPVVFLAGLLAGAIMVPLNARWTGAELAYGILDSGARFVFAYGERLSRLMHVAADLPPGVEQVFVTRAASVPPGVTALEDVTGAPAHWRDLPEGAMPDVALLPEDDATIFYTSGTTGAPKGALGTHRALTTNIFARPFLAARNALRDGTTAAARQGETAQGVTLLAVPFFHVVGSLSVMLPAMAAGGKLVLMAKFEPEAALRLIEREKVAVTGGVPAIVRALLEHPRLREFDLSSLKLVSYGGAPSPADLPVRIAAAFAGASAGNGWGMTETSATCTSHSGRDYLHRRESCGPALPVSRIKVLVEGRAAAPGQVGELWAAPGHRPALSRRLGEDGRPGQHRRGRLLHHRGPRHRHGDPRRREHLLHRGGECSDPSSGGGRCGAGGAGPSAAGRGARGPGAGARAGQRTGAARFRGHPSGRLQGAGTYPDFAARAGAQRRRQAGAPRTGQGV